MARKPQPEWWIYKEQMDFLCYGDALWQPAPTGYTRIAVGDVGFIRRGRFHLLFSAGSPLGERRRGEDVPATFEELIVGPLVRDQPRVPGCLCTTGIRGVGAGVSATASTTTPLEIGANFSFELTGNRGAALVTKYSTYREDSVLESAFEKYTKRHYKSWVAFARHKDYGNDVQPVLVSGFDMTRDFAMVSYSYEDTYIESDLTVAAPMLVSASASLWGTWRTRYTPHTNYGPQDCAPPPLEQAIDISSLQLTEPGIIPSAFNQCVFIRYYTMRSRGPFGLFPEVIQAGAEPHDLGPGENTGNTFPELTVQSDAGLTASDDEDYGGQWTPTADNTNLQPDTVIRNTPYDKEYDSWGPVADYVFQNSNATSVLMHHRDLAEIHEDGVHDVSFLLAKNRPDIVVDESGVGRIIYRHSSIPAWKSLVDRPPAIAERISLITVIFSDSDETEAVKCLSGDAAQSFIDVVDEILDSLTLQLRNKCLGALCEICSRQALLPISLERIPLPYRPSIDPLYGGGSSEEWVGEYQGRKISVKALRVNSSKFNNITKTFYKNVIMWKSLCHPNVLPLLGVITSDSHLATVSEFMPNGSILAFVRAHRDANRFELLKDVARGLVYIHGVGMVLGGLTGTKILIDQDGHACLADFRFLSISDSTASSPPSSVGTIKWTSPERLDPGRFGFEDSRATMESDCYALGMVILEVLTDGRSPFPYYDESTIRKKIVNGERPQRPQGREAVWFTDDLWGMLEQCWSPQPRVRPTAEVILEHLERGSMVWQPLPPAAGDLRQKRMKGVDYI